MENKVEKFKKKIAKIARDKETLKKLKGGEPAAVVDQDDDVHMDKDLTYDNFIVHPREEKSKVVQDLNVKSVKSRSKFSSSEPQPHIIKPVRTSFTNIDNTIIEVMVNMESQR